MSKRQKHWHLHMTDLSKCRKYILNCPRIKESHLGKCRNEKLRTWTLVNDRTLRNTADFPWVLANVSNVKISLVVEVYSSRKLQDYENIHREDSFTINLKKFLLEVSFCFHLQLRKTIFERLLSYDVTLVRKCIKQFQNKWNKDF